MKKIQSMRKKRQSSTKTDQYSMKQDKLDVRLSDSNYSPQGNLTFGKAIGKGTSSIVKLVTDEHGSKYAAKTFKAQ